MGRRVFEVGPGGEAAERPVYDREAKLHELRAHYTQKMSESTWAKVTMKLTGETPEQWVERMVRADIKLYDEKMSGSTK